VSNLFTITIPDSPAALLVTYGAGALIRVQSSPTEGGLYGDIPNPTQPIVAGVTTYPVYDSDGLPSDWYKFRYESEDGNTVGTYSEATQPQPQSSVYASLATFKNYVRTESDDEDELLGLALAAASRAIDRHTNRTFATTLGAVEDRYYSSLNGVIKIDDLMTASGLAIAWDSAGDYTYATSVDAADYFLAPIGALVVGKPYTAIHVPGLPNGTVKVTGLWGWQQVPLTIQEACLIQASRYWARRNSPYGIAGSPDMGSEMRLLNKLDPDVQHMLASYINWWAAV